MIPSDSLEAATALRCAQMLESADLARIPTPFLAIDLAALERNIARMAGFFGRQASYLRPHVKSHKCTAIARLQLAAGARGVTCSTTDEAAAMVAGGVADVLLANVVTDRHRLRSLAESAAKTTTLTAAVDSLEAVGLLDRAARLTGATIGVVLDCDIGMGRNGLQTVEEGLELAAAIGGLPSLVLRGVMAYEGHVIQIADRCRRGEAALAAFALPLALKRALADAGFDAPVLTGGATATYDSVGALEGMTDVQAGTYVLMDATYRELAPEFECAAITIASVLTSKSDGRVVVDAGSKRLAVDWGKPELMHFAARFEYAAEEHSVFSLVSGRRPRVGERVPLLPAHVCSTMSLYRRVPACRDGRLERVFEIDARDPLA